MLCVHPKGTQHDRSEGALLLFGDGAKKLPHFLGKPESHGRLLVPITGGWLCLSHTYHCSRCAFTCNRMSTKDIHLLLFGLFYVRQGLTCGGHSLFLDITLGSFFGVVTGATLVRLAGVKPSCMAYCLMRSVVL
jgi:hypothetical protein